MNHKATAEGHQKEMRLRDPRHRPTVGMEGAKHLLDLSEDEVLELIEDGSIAYAWHIGLGGERREVRILRDCIDHHLATPETPYPLTDDEVLRMLLPPGHEKPFVTNGELQRMLNCVSDHVLHLVDGGELQLVKGTDYSRGPNGAALVTIESVKRFLQRRRLL